MEVLLPSKCSFESYLITKQPKFFAYARLSLTSISLSNINFNLWEIVIFMHILASGFRMNHCACSKIFVRNGGEHPKERTGITREPAGSRSPLRRSRTSLNKTPQICRKLQAYRVDCFYLKYEQG